MINQHRTKAAFTEARGSLPAWFWRAMDAATHEASDDIPVLVVRDGQQQLAVLHLGDWNPLMRGAADDLEREAARRETS